MSHDFRVARKCLVFLKGHLLKKQSPQTEAKNWRPAILTSRAMAGGFFTTSVTWEAQHLPHEILDVNTHQNKIEASIGRMLFLSIFHFDSLTTVAFR